MFDIGTIKLSDFGLSKSLPINKHAGYDVNATFRLTGETGSYRYMAPEVISLCLPSQLACCASKHLLSFQKACGCTICSLGGCTPCICIKD